MRGTAIGILARVVLLLALLASPAFGASQKDRDDCAALNGDAQIAACTRVIDDKTESVENRAAAYDNRGDAWFEKEDYARARADYTAAIELDPNLASAYSGRGLTWEAEED